MSDAMFRSAIEALTDGVVVVDPADRLVAWNRAYRDLVPEVVAQLRPGMPYREAIATVARVRRNLTDPAAIEAAVETRLAQRRAGVPFDSLRPDGGITEIVDRRTDDGGYVSTYRDVTAARRASAGLVEAKAIAERLEAQFRDGLDSLTDGVILLDAEDRIVTWNAAYRRFFVEGSTVARVGMTFEDYVRATWEVRRQRDPGVDVEAAVRRRLEAHGRIGVPFEIRAVNGMTIQATVQRTAFGGRIVVFRDVTAERRALAAAEGIATEFREGIDSMLDGFAQFDAAQRLVNWNRRYVAMFPHLAGGLRRGMPLAEVFSMHAASPLYEIAPEERAGWVARALAHVWGNAQTSLNRELRDGRTIWGITTRTESGGIIFVLRDVTELRDQERRLAVALEREREIAAQQRRFVAVTAHEFRTPLTIIDGAAQRMIRYADRLQPDELRERAGKVRAAVARMSQLIDATLNVARLDEGRIGMQVAPVDLGALVDGVCRRLEGLAAGLAIEVRHPASPAIVRGDPGLLDQIVTNLVSNAVKYSGESRRIEVSLALRDSEVTLEVVDFGIGIPDAEIGHVFERFFRASTARGLPGTGIGLNLVRELVTLHGGRVAVASRVGEGTRVTVVLPRAPAAADGAGPIAAARAG